MMGKPNKTEKINQKNFANQNYKKEIFYGVNLKTILTGVLILSLILGLCGGVSAYSGSGGTCNCGDGTTALGGNDTDACVDCTAALNDNMNCTNQVNYVGTVTILNYSGTCINDPGNFTNKTFDCQGHMIDGTDEVLNWGIFLNGTSNNTIKNCVMTDFDYGIWILNADNNSMINNTLNSNRNAGIWIETSTNNYLANNTFDNPEKEWFVVPAVTNIEADCSHVLENNTGPNGYLIKLYNNSAVNLQNETFFMLMLCNADNSSLYNITIADGGGGINLWDTEYTNVTKCNSSNGNAGIYIRRSSNNRIINNTCNNNTLGIRLYISSHNNTVSGNTVNLNHNDGIWILSTSKNNTLNSNTLCGNGIFSLYDITNDELTSSNTGDNNTCDTTNNWNDTGTTGCTFSCQQNITTCYCSNCSDCNERLDADCSTVRLTADIINHSENCINDPRRFNGKTFDCQGHTIDGTGSGSGIYLNGKIGNTIKNCTLTDFSIGIHLQSSTNNNLTNNNASSNTCTGPYCQATGIYLHSSPNNVLEKNTANKNTCGYGYCQASGIYLYSSSSNNNLTDNTANENTHHGILLSSSPNNNLINNTVNSNDQYGIYLESSSNNNNIIKNTVNSNDQYGIYLESSLDNTIKNNIAKKNNISDINIYLCCNNIIKDNTGSGNRAIKYFNSSINLQNEVLSELILCNADNSNINNVTIAGSETLKNNGMIVYYTDKSNFTNINSSNNYDGIRLSYSSKNTLINNTANSNSNHFGIYLESSSNNNITNNTANLNNVSGIYLEESSNSNILENNTANLNHEFGIFLFTSSNNTLTGNTVNNNTYGIRLDSSSNNTLRENEISNNIIGIYSQNSNSTINSNIVCRNTNLDFNSTGWFSSTGDNNTCSNPDGWNDTGGTNGCTNNCVIKSPSSCNLTLVPLSPQIYGNPVTASCSCTNAEDDAKLYRNGVDVTSSENGTPVLLPAGNHSYVCNVSETENYSAASALSGYQINKATSSCDLTFGPSSPQTYGSEVTAACSCTNPEASAKLYWDEVNVSSSENGTGVVLAAGTHNYVCNVTGTQNYTAASNSSTYHVNKANGSQTLTLTANPSWTVTDGAQTTVSCTANTNQVAPQLYRNGSSVNNPDVETLALGTYNYTCNATETENYTAGEVSNTLTVTPKTPSQCNLTFNPASPATYGNTLTVTCSCTSPEASAKLYRDGINVTSSENGTPVLLPAGNHSYVCNVSETENYSAASESSSYLINKATSSCDLTFGPSSPQTYGSKVTAACSCTNPEASAKLYRDGVNVTSSENGTGVVLVAGTHNYICNVTATQNYSAASNLSTYQIDYHLCDINHDGIYLHDYRDLMSAYKCFLGVERNCNSINLQDWNLMKQEYDCFTGNFN